MFSNYSWSDKPRDLSVICSCYLVAIPVLQQFILSNCPKVMRILFESDLHDTLVMSKYRFVTVTEIKPPDFNIFVRGTSDYQLRVVRDVH
jgi:hypothetical protein